MTPEGGFVPADKGSKKAKAACGSGGCGTCGPTPKSKTKANNIDSDEEEGEWALTPV